MNRKFIFTLIVGIYLLNSIGIPVYYHYCGGELENVTALFKTNTCCDGEEEDENSDCCQNVVKVILQHNESRLTEKNIFAVQDQIIPHTSVFEFNETCLVSKLIHLNPEKDFIPKEKGREILLNKSVLII